MINIHLLCIPRQLDSCLVDGAPICCRFGLCSPDHANQDLTLCHYIICLDHGCHWGHRPAFLLPVDSSMVLAQSKTNSLLSMLQESSIGLNLLRDRIACFVHLSNKDFHYWILLCSSLLYSIWRIASLEPIILAPQKCTPSTVILRDRSSVDYFLFGLGALLSPGELLKHVQFITV